MPKRKRKKYSKPRKPFDKLRIIEENELVKKYGLKNKKEIWKADAAIRRIRNMAKKLITKSDEEKKSFTEKLQKKGFKVESIADALALNKENWLKRRLQTIVHVKKLANTPRQARQFVVHRHVNIGNKIINIPSYQVGLEKEPEVKLNIILKIKKQEKPKKEVKTKVEQPSEKVKEKIEQAKPEKEIKTKGEIETKEENKGEK